MVGQKLSAVNVADKRPWERMHAAVRGKELSIMQPNLIIPAVARATDKHLLSSFEV